MNIDLINPTAIANMVAAPARALERLRPPFPVLDGPVLRALRSQTEQVRRGIQQAFPSYEVTLPRGSVAVDRP